MTQVTLWALVLVLFGTNGGSAKIGWIATVMKTHVPIRQHTSTVHNGDATMKTKYEVRLPVRLGPEWGFSLWFALLSPVIGILLGILGVFLLYH